MNLENLFEDLESHFEALSSDTANPLQNLGTASIERAGRTLRLTSLVYAKDFVLGRSGACAFVIPNSRLGIATLSRGAAELSKQKLVDWLENLPPKTWLRLEVAGEHLSGRLVAIRGGLLFVGSHAVSIACVNLIELRAVDN